MSAMGTLGRTGLAIVAGASVLALFVAERRRHDHQLAELRKEMAAVSAAVADERQQAANDQASLHVLGPHPPPAVAAPPPQREARAEPREPAASESAKPPPMEPTELRDHYQYVFSEDSADPEWRGGVRRAAVDKVNAALPRGSSLRSFECRSSMCRVETSHVDRRHYGDFLRAAFMNPSTSVWNAGGFSLPVEDGPSGELVAVTYIAHEGQQLPSPN
jgi:hypothetical protein